MNQALMMFQFQQQEVRIVDEQGSLWFVAKDVCGILGIRWSGNKVTLSKIRENWKGYLEIQDTQGTFQETVIINEAALYKLAFRSNKPGAEAFTDWVASEVIPSIRKTGKYELPVEAVKQLQALQSQVTQYEVRLKKRDHQILEQRDLVTVKRAHVDRLQEAIRSLKRRLQRQGRTLNWLLNRDRRGRQQGNLPQTVMRRVGNLIPRSISEI